ncbi:MarR family winged helix-turn-helix transcriptional regulator [Rhodovulum sp. DZ06]|uniref:MarR family winged helix-turn-helix transcriptional regulator n=1 Tax=Rhodovulum sp. DZ06 TaxID=3425126 RepID=UPI003D3462CE
MAPTIARTDAADRPQDAPGTGAAPGPGDARRAPADPAADPARDGPLFQDIARFRGILFDRLLRPHDVTMAQGWALLHLSQAERAEKTEDRSETAPNPNPAPAAAAAARRGMSQSDLARRLEIGVVATSKLIDRLESRGLVERRVDPGDRRSNRVHATPAGRALLRAMAEVQAEVDALAAAGIDPAELETALRVLAAMRGNLRAAIARG